MQKVKFNPQSFIVRYTLRSKTNWVQHRANPTLTQRKALQHPDTGKTQYFRTFNEAVMASTRLVNHHLTENCEKEVHDITIVSHTKIAKGHEL